MRAIIIHFFESQVPFGYFYDDCQTACMASQIFQVRMAFFKPLGGGRWWGFLMALN